MAHINTCVYAMSLVSVVRF